MQTCNVQNVICAVLLSEHISDPWPGADVGGERGPGVDVAGAAQVAYLHQAGGGAQQQVAGLDVAMGDAEIVQILKTGQKHQYQQLKC